MRLLTQKGIPIGVAVSAIQKAIRRGDAMTAENQMFGDIARWHSAWKKYAIQRMDASNAVLMSVQRLLRSAIEASRKANPSHRLSDLIGDCLTRLDSQLRAAQLPYDRDYLTAVILFEASEN